MLEFVEFGLRRNTRGFSLTRNGYVLPPDAPTGAKNKHVERLLHYDYYDDRYYCYDYHNDVSI